jgi:hypothetical protein
MLLFSSDFENENPRNKNIEANVCEITFDALVLNSGLDNFALINANKDKNIAPIAHSIKISVIIIPVWQYYTYNTIY